LAEGSDRSLLRWRQIPGSVWALGVVSMLMDISSEMIHALLPLYLVVGLGASALAVGVIEGVAEATALIVRVFSGALSDRLGHRKWLAAAGYGLAAMTKPVFPLAPSVGWLFAARFIDRIGKGIRTAPRDALIADITTPDLRGASFGLRQSLDTIGAFIGPLAAVALMLLTADNFTLVFWFAVMPAFLSFAVIALAVREPERPADLKPVRSPLSRAEIARLDGAFWIVVTLAGTLLMPATKGPHPALVLIHGSTPLVRYYFGAAPYNYAANGIAVLFYDKRGCGESGGKLSGATIETLAADAVAGVKYLKNRKDINPNQIGVDGHSQGGWVAPTAAVMSKDVAFVMAGAGEALTGSKLARLNNAASRARDEAAWRAIVASVPFTR